MSCNARLCSAFSCSARLCHFTHAVRCSAKVCHPVLCHALRYLPCFAVFSILVALHTLCFASFLCLVNMCDPGSLHLPMSVGHSTFHYFQQSARCRVPESCNLLCSWCASWSWTARRSSCVHSLLLCQSGFKAPRALVWAMQPGQASGGRAWLQSPADSSLARAAVLVRHATLQYLWLQHVCLVWLCKPQDPGLSPCMVT